MKLKDLPEHMQTETWILSEIQHEKFEGVRTVHFCECGRGYCRSVMCEKCWKEVLEELK